MIQEKKQIFLLLLLGIMSCLSLLLCMEYRFFRAESRRLVDLQEQYRLYIEEVYVMLEKQSQDDALVGSLFLRENSDATNIFVNREESYLKESMIAHLKEQGFESLLNRVTLDESIDYGNDTVPVAAVTKPTPKTVVKKETPRKKTTQQRARPLLGLPMSWPIERNRFWLSSLFGPRKNPDNSWGFHRGVDMAALKGTPVRAAASGVVCEARYASGYGNMVVLHHARKYKTRYAHLDTIGVKVGQKITRGNVLGTVGDTGLVRKLGKDASHLHFEVCVSGKQVNPLQFFS